jgi:methylmalonyl-CoA/ethylmalonyl-CoA epimerase
VTPLLVGVLGGADLGGGPGNGFRGWQWRYDGGGVIEVLEPAGPPGGFLHRFVEQRGDGLHHVTFKVPSLDAACERAARLGYTVVGYDASDPGWKEAFLHPKEGLGIVVQMAESDPSIAGGWSSGQPPATPRPGEPVAVLGLRLRCERREAAKRQWHALLGGEESGDGEHVVYRWAGSPMRIAVEIAAGGDGPIGIEVDRLPEAALAHPLAGAFVLASA